MKKLILIFSCLLLPFAAVAKDPEVTDIALSGKGTGNGGRPLVYVTCAAKKADKVADADIAKCAIRGILFRGYADQSKSAGFDSSTNHPSLCSPDAEATNADYFKDFFESGQASTYVDILPDNRKVTKAGKVYHVTELVQVNVPGLRSKLEKDGIIRSLRSGW